MSTRATVLIVEDNFDNREIYATILEVAGYRVVQAEDGREGVARAREHLPDLILMDISMPVMDGYEAFAVLRADPTTRHIPVIAVTAHALVTERELILAAGFDEYVAKPCHPHDLRDAVRNRIGDP